ncbi:hypothetical protein RFI_31641, partial [Reticulomyxa filosa]
MDYHHHLPPNTLFFRYDRKFSDTKFKLFFLHVFYHTYYYWSIRCYCCYFFWNHVIYTYYICDNGELDDLISFLQDGPDTTLRVISTNHKANFIRTYLDQESNTLYSSVTLKSLRQANQSSFIKCFYNFCYFIHDDDGLIDILKFYLQIWTEVKDEIKCQFPIILIQLPIAIGVFGVTFVFGPIYLLSRFLTIFFPAIF